MTALAIPRVPPPASTAPGPGRLARWGASLTLGVAAASALGVPPAGAFPGTWLALSLAVERATSSPAYLVVALATGLGVAVGLFASVPLIRSPVVGRVALTAGVPIGAALLYIGAQPVRLGLGWWLRVERETGLPQLLPAAGGPALPPVGGRDLALVFVPAVVVVLAVVLLGRDLRDSDAPLAPLWPRSRRRLGRRATRYPAARSLGRARGALRRVPSRASDLAVGFGVAMILEVAAVIMAVRLVFLGARAGFL